MTTVAELIKQRDALEAQIAQARRQEQEQAVKAVRELVEQHRLTAEDIFGPSRGGLKRRKDTAPKVAAKYRDPASGKTWSGRGRVPAWLSGKTRTDFLIG